MSAPQRCPGNSFVARVGSITGKARKAPVIYVGDESAVAAATIILSLELALGVGIWYNSNMEYRHESHCVHLVVYHVIWCPKRRRKVLVGDIAIRMKALVYEVCEEHNWEVVELAIQPDHIHLFVRANPYTLPTDIPRLIKGRSSRVLREEFPGLLKLPSLWTRSYFLSTAGNVSSEIIQKYIERQSKV